MFEWPLSLAKTEKWFQNQLFDNTKMNFSIVDKKSGEKTGSISKKQDQSWVLTGNKEQLFVMVSGSSNISKVNYSTGEISNLLSETIDFKAISNEVIVNVSPLPEKGKPDSFAGAVGDFSFEVC